MNPLIIDGNDPELVCKVADAIERGQGYALGLASCTPKQRAIVQTQIRDIEAAYRNVMRHPIGNAFRTAQL